MKVIVCGPFDLEDYELVCKAIEASGFTITEYVTNSSKGAQGLGEKWASENDVPIKLFPIEWDNLALPGAVSKPHKWKKNTLMNANAGAYSNQQMVDYIGADGGVIFVDAGGAGSGNIYRLGEKAKAKCFRYKPEDHMTDDEYGYHF